MTKSFLAKFGLTLGAIALVGAGCAGGSSGSPADAFKKGLEEANTANANVQVTSPKANETVTTVPLQVTGTGATPGAAVYAGLYEFGNKNVEVQVTADDKGAFYFKEIWMMGEHDPKIELRVGEKDEAGNLIKFTKVPLTFSAGN
ncbi:MAG: hypothetical protein WC813_02235 [Patescibacteria group bacterium]|jgi:hypothetical protein